MADFLRGFPLFRRMTRTLQEFPCRVYVLLLVSHLSGLKKQIQNTWKFDIFDSHLTKHLACMNHAMKMKPTNGFLCRTSDDVEDPDDLCITS